VQNLVDISAGVPVIGPILWGHSGPLCHALSLLLSSSSSLLRTSMRRRRATVGTPGEWQCGVRRLAVANGPNIFQMLLVFCSPHARRAIEPPCENMTSSTKPEIHDVSQRRHSHGDMLVGLQKFGKVMPCGF